MSNNLFTSDVDGATRPATAEEILDAARTILARRIRRGASIANPRATREFLRLRLAIHDHEVFAILFLDNRHRLIEFVPLFRGTIDGASVHPREVVKEALSRNAASVILAHNHPSGVAEPSQADEMITHRLRDALALIDVRVLDHFVVTGDEIVSPSRSAACSESPPLFLAGALTRAGEVRTIEVDSGEPAHRASPVTSNGSAFLIERTTYSSGAVARSRRR